MLNIVVYCYWEYFENSWERHWFICLSLKKWSCSRLVLYSHQHVQNSFFTVKFCPVALSDSSNERKSIALSESHISSIAQFVQIVQKIRYGQFGQTINLFNESYQILNSLHFGQFWTILVTFGQFYFGQIWTFILFDILIVHHNGILNTNFQRSRAHFQIDHFKKKKQKSRNSIIALLFLNNSMPKNAGNNSSVLFFKYPQVFQKKFKKFFMQIQKRIDFSHKTPIQQIQWLPTLGLSLTFLFSTN